MARQDRSAYFRYRLLARFAEILPVKGVRVIGGIAGYVGPWADADRAALVGRNLRRVLGREPTKREIRHTYSSYVRYWLHAFRLPIVEKDYLERTVKSEGFDHIIEAREQGKGVILALPHVGNWDAAGVWLTSRGVPLTVVVERLSPENIHTWFEQFRASLGMQTVVNGENVATELSTALKRNDAIALLCDRDVDGTGAPVEFFGEVTLLPKGPALLALRSGAPLLPVAVYEKDDTFTAVIGSPVEVRRTDAGLREDVRRVSEVLTRRIEDLIRREPTQWHLFQPNWPSDRATPTEPMTGG